MKALLLICCVAVVGCTAGPRVYHAPDDSRVRAATTDLNVKVDRARNTARQSKKAGEEAKALHDQVMKDTGTVKDLLDKLAIKVPDEYKGPLRDITAIVETLVGENADLDRKLKELTTWNLQLESELDSAEKARATLQKAQDEYAGSAAELAGQATSESQKRYEAQRQLVKEKIISILWKVGGGFFVVALLVLAALWATGKLGGLGAKIVSKFP